MPDTRNTADPIPITEFTFQVKAMRYVQVDILSWYGNGGGLQYFSVSKIKWKGCIDNEVLAGYVCKI